LIKREKKGEEEKNKEQSAIINRSMQAGEKGEMYNNNAELDRTPIKVRLNCCRK